MSQILRPSVTKIYIHVTASDGESTAGPIMVPVKMPAQILEQEYAVTQSESAVKDLTVEYRPNKTHNVTGLQFDGRDLTIGAVTKLPDTPAASTLMSVTGTKAIALMTTTVAGEVPFKTVSVGTATVTIQKYIVDPDDSTKHKKDGDAMPFRVMVKRVTEDQVMVD